jgi:DNA-binding MarR family transcriptional regulator
MIMQPSLDRDLVVLLADVARLMRTRIDQWARAKAQGMTRAQWIILARLEKTPGTSQNELASIIEVEPITIARLVHRLEARGLVERRRDPKDRRIRRLHLTEQATPLLKQIHEARENMKCLLTDGISNEAMAITLETLMQMKAKLSAEARAIACALKDDTT